MAKITHGPTVSDTRGKAGDVQFQKSRGGNYIRASRLSAPMSGLPDQVFRIPPAGGTPAFGAVDLTKSAAVSGPLPVSFGGTGTATGSITGTGALTFAAGGADQNITLIPSGLGTAGVRHAYSFADLTVEGGVTLDGRLAMVSNAGWLAADFWLWRAMHSDKSLRLLSGSKTWPLDPANSAVLIVTTGHNIGIGTLDPGHRLDVGGGNIRTDGQLISTVAPGTAPLDVTSTTEVANLRAATATDLAPGSILTVAKGGTGRGAGSIPVYANNAAAIAGGLAVGDFYRTGADPDPVCVVH